jgi:hypothetical protein
MLDGVATSTYLHDESKSAPPLLNSMLNGVVISTYLQKESNSATPSEQYVE